ncbi:hypothetical protein [Salinigranum halophilum]|uniref:hypothetical protein n=1 Tax=Salinigranum halophilum TaxID=2565931 RepID=UPI00115D7967|nr:hypothetical protein [Salinigranum halophilum]
MSERPTVRPVTLGRLVELTHACEHDPQTTDDIETRLDVSRRRARETLLEAIRLDLVDELEDGDVLRYTTTDIGLEFLNAIREEAWDGVSSLLEAHSPHYHAFLEVLRDIGPAELELVLAELTHRESASNRTYNQTSIEILSDWGERLQAVQRNAFTGSYYVINDWSAPTAFADELLSVYDDLEQTAGVNLRQRYLSIPKLREHFCERTGCSRESFDKSLIELVSQNIGSLELSGAPIDTGAKDALLGIKSIALSDSDGLVSTTQSTAQIMTGVEQYGKQFYYLAVHERDITYTPNHNP